MAEAWGSRGSRESKYDIHDEIGSGGMATVHLGRLVGVGGFSRTVAIKVLHATYAKNKEFVERFLDEARLVGRIHHPNVMPTLDVISDRDDLRIVMEYVAGESLDQLVSMVKATGERIPMRVACAIIIGVLHGLHAAHEAKNEFGEPLDIVHLDVSPHNILVGADGTARLLDFGVARARGAGTGVTQGPTSAVGKPAYLAPEQVRGVEVSPRTDIFAAGTVLWEMLTGEPLFAADNHAATMQRVLTCIIPKPSEKVEGIPPRLDELLAVALARDPAKRFSTARDMALELEQSVVPAMASEVGSFLESVASATLAARAVKVQEMEAQSMNRRSAQMAGLVSTREMYGQEPMELLSSDLLLEANSDSLLRPAGRPEGLVPQRAPDGSIRWKAAGTNAGTQRSAMGAVGSPPTRTSSPDGAFALEPALARPAPLSPPPLVRPGPKTPSKLLWPALGAGVVLFALIAVAVRTVFWPDYVKSEVIAAAAAKGVTLTVESASLSGGGVELRGLTLKLMSVPEIKCAVATADVRTASDAQPRAILGRTEIEVDGEVHAVLASLDAWSATRRTAPLGGQMLGGQVVMPVGHLVWTHPGGGAPHPSVTRIEATGLQGTFGGPNAVSLDDDVHLLTDALVVETRLGVFGPWNLDLDTTPKRTRARLALDPAVPDGANALAVFDASGDSSFDLGIPHLPMAGLGIPRTAFGSDVPFPQQLEVALHYGHIRQEGTKGSLRAAFFGVRVAELGAPVEVHLSGDAVGASEGPMTVKDGLFTFGAIRAGVTGILTPRRGGFKTNLEWKADPVSCSSLAALPSPVDAALDLSRKLTHPAASADVNDLGQLARDFGALGQAAGVVKVTGTFAASGTVVADSNDLTRAKFTIATKNACGITLFQGK